MVTKYHFFFINRYVTSATVKSSWGHPGESVTNLDISYLVVFTLQIVCDAILVWGAMKKIPNHLVPWLWANAVIIAVFLVSIFAVSKKLCLEFVLWLKLCEANINTKLIDKLFCKKHNLTFIRYKSFIQRDVKISSS